MKKYCLWITMFLFILCNSALAEQYKISKSIFADYQSEEALLDAIERGDANWEIVISSLRESKLSLDKISPSAVANYMEALANDKMMILIPLSYFKNEEIITALDVVFQDRWNVFNNWNIYEDRWLPDVMCNR